MFEKAVKDEFAAKPEPEKFAIIEYNMDKYVGDFANEWEESLADTFGLNDYPDDDEYDGPMLRLPDGTGYAIEVRLVRVDEKGEIVDTDKTTD